MGRPGATKVSRPKGPIQARQVQSKDPFPQDFLGFLHALPSDPPRHDEADHPVEPPKKRARVESIRPIPVARESITVKRPAQSGILLTAPTLRKNVNRHMKLRYDEASHTLAVSSNSRLPCGAFRSNLALGSPRLAESTLVVLAVLNRSRDADDEEGSLWVNVTISLENKDKKDQMQFTFELNWNPSVYSLRRPPQRALSKQVLDTFFESEKQGLDEFGTELSPRAFYDASFAPPQDHTGFSSLSVPKLTSRLYPFQIRALQWLLKREGVQWKDRCADGTPGLEPFSPPLADQLPLSFSAGKDADGSPVYVSDLYHAVTRDPSPFSKAESALRGGILAEEMGLGKTVETISLICTHKRRSLSRSDDDIVASGLRPSGATLIVTPATLQDQWASELCKHAPHLKAMVYDGLRGFVGEEDELVSVIAGHDVVLTTYNILQAEIHFAEEPPSRSMRHERKYRRPKSPLVQISWWRVCLDEAQQIESGVSGAAKLARLIPRINAWGITGTPVKENIKDLWGLLLFLQHEPFASSPAAWEGLMTSHQHLFEPLFNRVSLRHTKRAVRDELALPPQKRYIITVPFKAIEEQNYQERFTALARRCGLDGSGVPLDDQWDPESPYRIDQMKDALAELRQTILHPSLGVGLALRAVEQKNKPLRTIEEVLDVMIEQSDSSIRADQRNYLAKKLERGQILEAQSKVEEAIALWQEVLDEARPIEEECRKQLETELARAQQADPDEEPDDTEGNSSLNDEEAEGENAPKRVSECRRKLRSILDIRHRAVFFIASGYYQLKSDEDKVDPESEEFKTLEQKEVSGYEMARTIRNEILHEARKKASSYISRIREKAEAQSFVEIPEMECPPLHGLESRLVLADLELLSEALDGQANLIDEWREEIIQMLAKPLVDEDEEHEITGDEYEDSTKIQDELMVYTLAMRAAIADRQDAISGLENERIRYDTRFAERQAQNGEGHAPAKVLALLQQRQQAKPSGHGTSFRGIITDLRELATKLRYDVNNGSSRARVELEIVEQQLRLLQGQSSAQNKASLSLERELDGFVAALNARVEFYRQLQAVSDTVAPLGAERQKNLDSTAEMERNERVLQHRIALALSKHRYLVHLKEAGQDSDEVCVICQSSFTIGILTVCGHQFCKECLVAWFKASRSCPVCKKQLTSAMLHDITLKKQDLKVHQEHPRTSGDVNSGTKARNFGIYSQFSSEKLETIKGIDLHGRSYGTKVDTLIRHLLWLRIEDPGAKSVVFSQFGRFLDVLSPILQQYGIGFTSFRMKNGIKRFKEDPGIECFLMDARAHASGLNLVNASHVLLCEPLLNTALELQAIARVDRIGQEHETTVWLYLTEGTVEESIYDLSIQRRLEHLGKNTKGKSKESTPEVSDLNLEVANSLELEQAPLSRLMNKNQRLGEAVDKNDLWQCLFGNASKASTSTDERLNDPAVIGFLASEAVEARRLGQARGEGAAL